MARNRARRLAHPLPLPKNTILCGELVLDPSQPYNDVLAYPSDLVLDIRSTPLTNIHSTQGAGIGADFRTQLMTFLSAQAHAMHLDYVEIKVPRGTKSLLRDSGTAFKKACGNDEVKDWLREHVIDEGRNAAMIVGMYTYSDASYVQKHRVEAGARLSASAPTRTTSVNATLGAGAATLDQHTFNMPEEQIFAVEYRRLKFRRWSKRKLADAKLEQGPNMWEVFLGDRSKGTAADEQENIVEFELDSASVADDDEDDIEEMQDEEDESTSLEFEGSRDEAET